MSKQSLHVASLLGFTLMLMLFPWASAHATSVFFNEIHYDNIGGDADEAIEIAGPSGTDVTGWSIRLYNGNGGAPYGGALNLSGIIANQQNGFGTLAFSISGLQNGAPDGLALIDASNNVLQFLSYEGSLIAVGGEANGLTSTDIGVAESGSTPVGHSLQLIGTGTRASNFTWASATANSFGAVNTRQTFSGGMKTAVPEPSTILLLGSGMTGLIFWHWKKRPTAH